jgi:hypothetical protein
MESEIKLAWKQGYMQAMQDFTGFYWPDDQSRMERYAEDAWREQAEKIKVDRRCG